MRKRSLAGLVGLLVLGGGVAFHLSQPEQAEEITPTNVPLQTAPVEEKVEPIKQTGYLSLTRQGGLTFYSRFGKKETHEAKYFLGPGTDQISPDLDQEQFYEAASILPKKLQVRTVLNTTPFFIGLGNRLAKRAEESEELRDPHETTVMKRDIVRDFTKISDQIVEEGLIPGYLPIDTDYIRNTLLTEGALRRAYPLDSVIEFTYIPGQPPENGIFTITDYNLIGKPDENGKVNYELVPIEGLETRTYTDSPTGSFDGWFNGRMRHEFTEEDRCDALIGESHLDMGFKHYRTDKTQFAKASQ